MAQWSLPQGRRIRLTCGSFTCDPWNPSPPVLQAFQRSVEILGQFQERKTQSGPAPNQDIIAASMQISRGRKPHDFPQTSSQAVAFDRAANLLGHREPN